MDKLQFGKVPHGDYDRAATPENQAAMKTPHISPGAYKRVWHKPIFGLLNSNSKWIPTNFAPLTFEFTLQNGAQWCDTTPRDNPAGGAGIPASTAYQLRNLYLYYDIVTLDSELHFIGYTFGFIRSRLLLYDCTPRGPPLAAA